jgi:two-component system response regulator RpaA
MQDSVESPLSTEAQPPISPPPPTEDAPTTEPARLSRKDATLVKTLQNEDAPQKRKWRGGNQRNVFTTGQVARICQVASRTVSKWFDSGKLQGYRIPGSNDRRVPRRNLLEFLRESKIDVSWLCHMPWDTVLLVGVEEHMHKTVVWRLPEGEGYRILYCGNLVEAAVLAGETHPDVAVIDMSLPDARHLSRSLCRTGTACLALTNEDDPGTESWAQTGFASHLQKPAPPDEVVREVKRLLVTK